MKNSVAIRKLTISGVFIALAVLVEFIHFPIFPSAPFLEYDAAGVIILVSAFVLGPWTGALLGIITAGLHVLFGGNNATYGFLMNAVALAIFALTTILIFRFLKKEMDDNIVLIISCILGILFTTGIMIPANLIITPLFMGVPKSAVEVMLLFPIIPFNLIKWTINAVLGVVIFKILLKTELLSHFD
jgi:riboflavin transporter FmnP